MNRTFFILPALLLTFGCSNAKQPQDTPTSAAITEPPQDNHRNASSQVTLPDSALAFIRQHFTTVELKRVKSKKSPTADGTFYEARLTDDTEIDFGKEGNWIEVNAEEPHQLPTSFFPNPIRTHLESNFAGIGVESIDKDAKGYELELTNDINLYFDAAGSFLRQEK